MGHSDYSPFPSQSYSEFDAKHICVECAVKIGWMQILFSLHRKQNNPICSRQQLLNASFRSFFYSFTKINKAQYLERKKD